jgi:hypothetical protein
MLDSRKTFFHLFSEEYCFLKREPVWSGRDVGTVLWNMLPCYLGKERHFLLTVEGGRRFPETLMTFTILRSNRFQNVVIFRFPILWTASITPFSVSNERKQHITKEELCLK